MLILVISLISFILICMVVDFIDKNKEKLLEKFNIEKKEIMECPHCFNQYEDLSMHFCKHCDTSLNKKIKYKLPKKLKKKIRYIVLSIIGVIIVGFCAYVGISNFIQKQQEIEQYNRDINLCYETIKNDLNWDNFKKIVDKHSQESNFEPEAYEKLYYAIDERINNIKNGNYDNALISMLDEIKNDKNLNSIANSILEKIEDKKLKAKSYSNINESNKNIEEQKYKEAYDLLETVITDNKDQNQEILDIAKNKQNEIQDKAFEQIITQAQEKINAQDYSSAKTLLEKYKDLGNQTILDMYNNATNEVNRIEAEKKAKEEEERKAREKKEAEEKAKQAEEERKRQQAELDAKKDKLTINSNGKKIWKVCMDSNTFRFQATYRGYGNFIVKLLDSNQDLEEMICNEIGDYNVDKTVQVVKGNYYYIETYVSDGSWNGTWWGTYGD